MPYRAWYAAGRAELLEPASRTDAALNVLFVASLLLAAGRVGYAVAVPKQGEAFTEFYLLTRGEDGERVAADYPNELVEGEPRPLVVGIENQEHETVAYTVLVELKRVEFAGNESRVVEERSLHGFSATLADNETIQRKYEIRPTMTGEGIRLAFLLYRGEPPAEPTVENAYRETHLWLNVTSSGLATVRREDVSAVGDVAFGKRTRRANPPTRRRSPRRRLC